ncbi:MAG TPA: PLP-dependent aminotransferase family protein [Gaiellales bacterium]|nr:PLP-dependent aminotransferase family protein [Gaiellales bacterium]
MPATIPFTRGVPSADLLPVDDLRAAALAALDADPAGALAYVPGGYRPLREWIAGRHGVDPERVLLVNGSLQGVVFLAQTLLGGGGGTAVVEDPTYDRTLTVFRAAGAGLHPVSLERDGLAVDALAADLRAGLRASVAYVIPTFQNPAGVSLSLEKRRALVELARDHGMLLIEDDPYRLLRFEGEPLPSLHELDGGDNVVYSSSFTKTVAPGLRTGYLVLPERLVKPLAAISANTYIGPNAFAEAVLAAYCKAGRFEPNVARTTADLRARRDAMADALGEHLADRATWLTPAGGYFFWVELRDGVDSAALLPEATARGVAFLQGNDFSASGTAGGALRLAFSACSPEQIGEGIERLAAVVAGRPSPAVA